MTILTVSKRGTLKLPREAIAHLQGAKHLQLKLGTIGVSLTPVKITNIKEIPPAKAG